MDTNTTVTVDTAKMRAAYDKSGYRTEYISRITSVSRSVVGRLKSSTKITTRVRVDSLMPIADMVGVSVESVLYHPPAPVTPAIEKTPDVASEARLNEQRAIAYIMDQLGITWIDILGEPSRPEIF